MITDCNHSEHALGDGGVRGRIIPELPSDDWTQWEVCPAETAKFYDIFKPELTANVEYKEKP